MVRDLTPSPRLLSALAFAALCYGALPSTAGACQLLGGDADGDGICDDGSNSLVVGDFPCSCPPGSPPACLSGCDDNCPWTFNPDQVDVGRVGDPDVPDGIGDACQCYDVADDGRGDLLDATWLRRVLEPLPPALPAPEKCPGAGPASCDAGDWWVLRETLAALAPAAPNVCMAAGACTASAHCPSGTACAGEQCVKSPGQACVQGTQCLGGGCCSALCRDLTTDAANCGGCGVTCQNPNGTTACATGQCAPSCNSTWGSCDGDPINGCEQPLTTLAHCGACNSVCNFPNAFQSCATGSCELTGCRPGWSNCDSSVGTGCEVGHWTTVEACGVIASVGTYDGDSSCGFICPSNLSWDLFATRSGTTSAWFKARMNEDSSCSAQLAHRIDLDVPPGIDYDLYLWRDCGAPAGGSNGGRLGAAEQVFVLQSDNSAIEDDFDYWIEVRYFAGASCASWQLRFYGHNC